MSEEMKKKPNGEVLIYGFGTSATRAVIAFFKLGYKIRFLLRGSYMQEIPNRIMSEIPHDMCFGCSWLPMKAPLEMGKLQIEFNSELVSISGKAGDFTVKYRTSRPCVDHVKCIECGKCVDVCPVEYEGKDGKRRKAVQMIPIIMWEHAYRIDFDKCTKCGECVRSCPADCISLDTKPELKEANVGAVMLEPEYEPADAETLEKYGYGLSPDVVRNAQLANFLMKCMGAKDAYKRPSNGEYPRKVAILITPQLNANEKDIDFTSAAVNAARRAGLILDVLPDADVRVYARNFLLTGMRNWKLYEQAKSKGARFERVRAVSGASGENGPLLSITSDKGETQEEEFDLVILMNGQKPPAYTTHGKAVAGISNIDFDESGFPSKIDGSTIRTKTPGIYVLGEFSGPKGMLRSICDAYLAAGDMPGLIGLPEAAPPPVPELREVTDEKPAVEIIYCTCGGELRSFVDFEKLEKQAAALPGVCGVKTVDLLCLSKGMEEVQKAIIESGANRVVFCGCGSTAQAGRFGKIMLNSKLSPSLMQVMRFREDIAWGVGDVPGNVDKAVRETASLVAFARGSRPYGMQMTDVTGSALVIGGGLSGMAVALQLASAGARVDLLIKRKELDCAFAECVYGAGAELDALLAGLVEKVRGNDKITVYSEAALADAKGRATYWDATFISAGQTFRKVYGAIVPAVGMKEWKPGGRFGLGQSGRVLTLMDFQNRITEGKKFDGKIVFIQCVGSRNNDHSYCSRACCASSAGNALALKKAGASPVIVYRDLTLVGESAGLEKKIVDAGVELIRAGDDDMEKSVEVQAKEKLVVKVASANGDISKIEADWVVLAAALEPDDDVARIAAMLGVKLNEQGFFMSMRDSYPYEEICKRNKPFEMQFGGIFPTGTCTGPLTWSEVIHQALSTAGMALTVITKKKIPPPFMWNSTSTTDRSCAGCGLCVEVCPYHARTIDPVKKTAVVHAALCEGCGACAAVCPSHAALVRNYEPSQVFSAVDEYLLPRKEVINA